MGPPADDASFLQRLVVVGTNHRTSPFVLRDGLAALEDDLPAELDRLRGIGVTDAVLIATCDRVELVTGAGGDVTRGMLATLLARHVGTPAEAIPPLLYAHSGEAALRHIFAVSSALDSLVIGEPQILGQMKAAHSAASRQGMLSTPLDGVFQAAFGAAKRVRSETQIAERPVSLAAAALQFARDVHGDLKRATGLLIGPSEMGELLAEQMLRGDLGRLMVCGPQMRAERVARRFGSLLHPFEDLDKALVEADIVISSVGDGKRLLSASRMEAALKRRRLKPMFVIDAAIPSDAEAKVNDLDGAFLYDLDDLERAAMAGRATREAASIAAWSIVDQEVAGFVRRQAERGAIPAVTALRDHFEAVRAQILDEGKGLGAEEATRLLVNRLLHDPSEVLRNMAAGGASDAGGMLARLFRLGEFKERKE